MQFSGAFTCMLRRIFLSAISHLQHFCNFQLSIFWILLHQQQRKTMAYHFNNKKTIPPSCIMIKSSTKLPSFWPIKVSEIGTCKAGGNTRNERKTNSHDQDNKTRLQRLNLVGSESIPKHKKRTKEHQNLKFKHTKSEGKKKHAKLETNFLQLHNFLAAVFLMLSSC